MNKNNFISAITHPEQIDLAQIEQLKELTRQFPYCTTAQILLAKGLHNHQDIAFEKQLRISAAYAMDRSVLHHLILERSAAPDFPGQEIPAVENTAPIVNDIPKIIAPIEKTAAIEQTPTSELKTEASTVLATQEAKEKEAPTEETVLKGEQEELNPFLEREILSAAIHNTYLLEADELNESEEVVIEEKTFATNLVSNKKSEHSFSDWLKLMNGQAAAKVEEEIAPKADSKDLVNKFIATTPKIKPKKEFYSASNMARLSVKENDDLVTETLANIYAQQGNTEKAILAYEKLALKYPEKRIYFANLIHKLGEEPKK